MSNNMEQVQTLTHRNLTVYLMEAGQDLAVRNGQVFDNQGRQLAKIQPQHKCCANCRSCHRIEMWGIKRLVCGDPTQATCVDVTPDGCCPYHEGADTEMGLTMDIWY